MWPRHKLGKYNLNHDQQERFWGKIEITKFCWIWKASVNSKSNFKGGYGKFTINNRSLRAHIYVWSLFNGLPPDGMVVAHTCDNRRCVNPSHLYLATQKENVLDMRSKNRQVKLIIMSERQAKIVAQSLKITFETLITAINKAEPIRPKGKKRRKTEKDI